MSILLILFFSYQHDNHQLKSSFAIEDSKIISNKNISEFIQNGDCNPIEDSKIISNKNISEFIQNGDCNLDIKRDFHKAIEWYNKTLEIDPENVDALSKKGKSLSRLSNFTGAI